MKITEEDKRNNPGVDEATIQTVKEQYHFHRLASVSLHDHTLHCTFQVDTDPTSIFYTPFEEGKEPVREYVIDGVDGGVDAADVVVLKDGLSVRVGEQYISSEEIFAS